MFAAALAPSTLQSSLQGPQLCCEWERQWQQAKEPSELHLLPIAEVRLCCLERTVEVSFLGDCRYCLNLVSYVMRVQQVYTLS